MSKHVYNLIKDRQDLRDRMYRAVRPESDLPVSVDNRHWFSPIRDQGSLGSCSSFSSAGGAFEMLENKELIQNLVLDAPEEFGSKFCQVSTLMQYQNTLILEGSFGQDNGAQIRDAVKALATYGVCTETTWPYNMINFGVKAPQSAYDEAAKHKITQYARLSGSNAIRSAIAHGLPVIFGASIFESFESEQVASNGIVPMPNINGEQFLGGHAICIAGYNENYYIVRNSWGASWADKGYCYIPKEYIENPDLTQDFWAITK